MKRGQDIAVTFPGLYLVHHNLPEKKVALHSHPEEHLLFIPLQGEIQIQLEIETLTAGPGKMIYLPKNTQHAFDSKGMQGERLIALIQDEDWKKLGGGNFTHGVIATSQLIKELLFYLLLNPKVKSAGALVATLCQTLSENLEASCHLLNIEHIESSVIDVNLRKALTFLSQRFNDSISMPGLAQAAGVSTRSLNRLFATELGLTPKQVLAQYRITRATELLTQEKKTVTEVAYEVGYNSLPQFITVFRQLTGQLPSEVSRLGKRAVIGQKP